MTIRDEIFSAISSADPAIKQSDLDFMHQAILLSCTQLGPDEQAIAEELQYDPEFVGLVGARLRNAGIWNGDTINAIHFECWQRPDDGGIAFHLDAAVAGGTMIVADRLKNGEPRYRMTRAGKDRVEKMQLRK